MKNNSFPGKNFDFLHTLFRFHFQNYSTLWDYVRFCLDFFLNLRRCRINKFRRTEFLFRLRFDLFLSLKIEFDFSTMVFWIFSRQKGPNWVKNDIYQFSSTRSIDWYVYCDVLKRKIIFYYFTYELWLKFSKLVFSSKHHNIHTTL